MINMDEHFFNFDKVLTSHLFVEGVQREGGLLCL